MANCFGVHRQTDLRRPTIFGACRRHQPEITSVTFLEVEDYYLGGPDGTHPEEQDEDDGLIDAAINSLEGFDKLKKEHKPRVKEILCSFMEDETKYEMSAEDLLWCEEVNKEACGGNPTKKPTKEEKSKKKKTLTKKSEIKSGAVEKKKEKEETKERRERESERLLKHYRHLVYICKSPGKKNASITINKK